MNSNTMSLQLFLALSIHFLQLTKRYLTTKFPCISTIFKILSRRMKLWRSVSRLKKCLVFIYYNYTSFSISVHVQFVCIGF